MDQSPQCSQTGDAASAISPDFRKGFDFDSLVLLISWSVWNERNRRRIQERINAATPPAVTNSGRSPCVDSGRLHVASASAGEGGALGGCALYLAVAKLYFVIGSCSILGKPGFG